MNEDVKWLRDVEEIKALKSRYGELVDQCPKRGLDAGRDLAQLFTEDAECDFSAVFGREINGREDIAFYFGDFMAKARGWMWHSFHSPQIKVEGDRAWGYWTLYAMSTAADEVDAEPKVSYGRYYDEFRRTADGWRQCKLKFVNETRNWVGLQAPARTAAE